MRVPTQIKYRLIHYKKQILRLVATQILSVVAVCEIMGISRNTFYKYRRQEKAGSLGNFYCAPYQHGQAKSAEVREKVLQTRQDFPHYGKRRIAAHLNGQGILICPNTCQKILRINNQVLPLEKRKPRHWRSFEAIKANTIWSIDICYLYTIKQDGFDLYLITILDDHSRFVVASQLFSQQTVVEVVEVLKQAVINYGVPQTLVCDNGVQFTCSEFQRVCQTLNLTLDYAPKHYPQYKGKLERFFRTTRKESQHANNIDMAFIYHQHWIHSYNYQRPHSSVLDLARHRQVPAFRFTWKPSAATPLPLALDINTAFLVKNSLGSITRLVKANKSISYKKQLLSFPHLNKGDRIFIQELKDVTLFFFLENLLLSLPKSPLNSTLTRKVKRDGSVLINRQRFSLSLPKDSLVIISPQADSFLFFFNGSQIFPLSGQQTVQQPI